MKKRPNINSFNIKQEFDADFDLNESTCTPETLAFLNRPDDEEGMPYEEWLKLYASRVEAGYYEKLKKDIPDSDLPF